MKQPQDFRQINQNYPKKLSFDQDYLSIYLARPSLSDPTTKFWVRVSMNMNNY